MKSTTVNLNGSKKEQYVTISLADMHHLIETRVLLYEKRMVYLRASGIDPLTDVDLLCMESSILTLCDLYILYFDDIDKKYEYVQCVYSKLYCS